MEKRLEKVGETELKDTVKDTVKDTAKDTVKIPLTKNQLDILENIRKNPYVTADELSVPVGINKINIKKTSLNSKPKV